VVVAWKSMNDPEDSKVTNMEIFPKGYQLPKLKTRNVTINRVDAKPFELAVQYGESPEVSKGNELICVCQVPKILKDNEMTRDVKVVVKLKADPQGLINVSEVEYQEEKEEMVEVPIVEEKKAEEKKPEEKKEVKPNGTEAKEGEGENKEDDQMKAETTSEQPKTKMELRKLVVSTKVTHVLLTPNELNDDQIYQYKKLEDEMAKQDDLVLATASAKNDLETYVYTATENLDGIWKEWIQQPSERQAVEEMAGQITMWLYDEGSDVSKVEYDAKMKAFKDVTGVIGGRLEEKIRKEEEEKRAKEEAIRKAKEEAEKKIKEEAERKAKEEAEAKAKLEEEKKAKEAAAKQQEEKKEDIDMKVD